MTLELTREGRAAQSCDPQDCLKPDLVPEVSDEVSQHPAYRFLIGRISGRNKGAAREWHRLARRRFREHGEQFQEADEAHQSSPIGEPRDAFRRAFAGDPGEPQSAPRSLEQVAEGT